MLVKMISTSWVLAARRNRDAIPKVLFVVCCDVENDEIQVARAEIRQGITDRCIGSYGHIGRDAGSSRHHRIAIGRVCIDDNYIHLVP